jgi:coenzyme F420-reducing hydrogenase beta subunit
MKGPENLLLERCFFNKIKIKGADSEKVVNKIKNNYKRVKTCTHEIAKRVCGISCGELGSSLLYSVVIVNTNEGASFLTHHKR